MSVSTAHSGLCVAIRSSTSTVQAKAMGIGRCLLCTDRGESQQGIVVYHGITSNQRQGGNLVQCRSSRQDLIAKSTCEAELIAASEALQQGEHISIVISEMINASCEIELSSENSAALSTPYGPE